MTGHWQRKLLGTLYNLSLLTVIFLLVSLCDRRFPLHFSDSCSNPAMYQHFWLLIQFLNRYPRPLVVEDCNLVGGSAIWPLYCSSSLYKNICLCSGSSSLFGCLHYRLPGKYVFFSPSGKSGPSALKHRYSYPDIMMHLVCFYTGTDGRLSHGLHQLLRIQQSKQEQSRTDSDLDSAFHADHDCSTHSRCRKLAGWLPPPSMSGSREVVTSPRGVSEQTG